MNAIIVARQGSPVSPNIQFVSDFASPKPAVGEALVRTEASALNHLDLWVGRGLPGIDLQYPRIGGSDGCGRVEAVGEGVDRAWIGKRVLLNAAKPVVEPPHPGRAPASPDIVMIGEHENGTHAEFFIAPAGNLLDIGDANPVHAAAFGLTHLTAWRMLRTRAGLQPGMTVLITGIGGGVAAAALNIARHFGCRIIVTSRHAAKIARAKALGAHDGVLDTGADWSREVRALTGKRGVDIVVDSIGKAVHLAGVKSLARGGVYVTCGCTTGGDATTDLARVFWNQLSIVGSTMGDMREFREVTSLFLSGAITPVVDDVFNAADGRAAYERLESGEQLGKIVIRW
jgi:NADPH:quinone reductase-like Zn-dependent oxidoreductase